MQERALPQAAARRDALPLSAAVASTLVLIVPVLSPKLQLFYRDTGRLYYPVKQYIAGRLARGELPLWDPWTEGGVSLLGQISPGVFHPFTLLYLIFPFDLAFKLNHLLALPMAAAGAYWLARRLRTAPWPSAVAGVVFGCSGYLVSTAASNLPYALGPASIPAAVAGLLWLCERPSGKRMLLAAGLLALCNYSGEPQSALLAAAIGGVCALAMSMGGEAVPARERMRRGLRAAGLTALWGALALALSMPAVLPGGLRAHASNRWHGLTEEERSLFSLHPLRLAALAVPRAFDDVESDNRASHYLSTFWEYLATSDRASFADSICLGLPAVLLALFAAFAERRGRALFGGALLFALASTGTALGVHELLNRLIPGLGLFRFSEKLIGPTSLLLALAAARGAELSLSGTRRAALQLLGLCVAVSLLGALAWQQLGAHDLSFLNWMVEHGTLHARPPALDLFVKLRWAAAMVAALALALALVALHRALSLRGLGFSPALACACCFTALMISDADLLFACSVDFYRSPPKVVEEMIQRGGPSAGSWRFHSSIESSLATSGSWLDPRFGASVGEATALSPQFDALFGLEGIEPYFSLLDEGYLAVLHLAPRALYQIMGVRFTLADRDAMSERQAKARGFVAFDGGWLGERPAQPRAFLVSRAWLAPPDGVLAMFNDPRFDPSKDALLTPAQRGLVGDIKESPDQPGETALRRASPEEIDVEVKAPARRLLVVSERADPGWTATIDGQAANVVTVNAMVLGVPVPAGPHRVQLRFWPQGFTVGLGCCALALLLSAAFILREGRRSQNPAGR